MAGDPARSRPGSPPTWWLLGVPATGVDLAAQQVHLADGTTIDADVAEVVLGAIEEEGRQWAKVLVGTPEALRRAWTPRQ